MLGGSCSRGSPPATGGASLQYVAVDVAESRHLDEGVGIDISQSQPYDDRPSVEGLD